MKMVDGTTFNTNHTKKTSGGLYLKKTELYCSPISSNNDDRIFRGSSMVEHATVNRRVVGSSPSRGANKGRFFKRRSSFFYFVLFSFLTPSFFLSPAEYMTIPTSLSSKLMGDSASCSLLRSG